MNLEVLGDDLRFVDASIRFANPVDGDQASPERR